MYANTIIDIIFSYTPEHARPLAWELGLIFASSCLGPVWAHPFVRSHIGNVNPDYDYVNQMTALLHSPPCLSTGCYFIGQHIVSGWTYINTLQLNQTVNNSNLLASSAAQCSSFCQQFSPCSWWTFAPGGYCRLFTAPTAATYTNTSAFGAASGYVTGPVQADVACPSAASNSCPGGYSELSCSGSSCPVNKNAGGMCGPGLAQCQSNGEVMN